MAEYTYPVFGNEANIAALHPNVDGITKPSTSPITIVRPSASSHSTDDWLYIHTLSTTHPTQTADRNYSISSTITTDSDTTTYTVPSSPETSSPINTRPFPSSKITSSDTTIYPNKPFPPFRLTTHSTAWTAGPALQMAAEARIRLSSSDEATDTNDAATIHPSSNYIPNLHNNFTRLLWPAQAAQMKKQDSLVLFSPSSADDDAFNTTQVHASTDLRPLRLQTYARFSYPSQEKQARVQQTVNRGGSEDASESEGTDNNNTHMIIKSTNLIPAAHTTSFRLSPTWAPQIVQKGRQDSIEAGVCRVDRVGCAEEGREADEVVRSECFAPMRFEMWTRLGLAAGC